MKAKTTKPHTIIWADDDADDRHVICDIVDAHYNDYHVHVVENGCDLLYYLDNFTDPAHLPCLVVLDINMPKLTGTETLGRIKADKRFQDLKVAVFTTSSSEQDRAICRHFDVPMVTKPYSYSGFERAVTDLLQLCDVAAGPSPAQS